MILFLYTWAGDPGQLWMPLSIGMMVQDDSFMIYQDPDNRHLAEFYILPSLHTRLPGSSVVMRTVDAIIPQPSRPRSDWLAEPQMGTDQGEVCGQQGGNSLDKYGIKRRCRAYGSVPHHTRGREQLTTNNRLWLRMLRTGGYNISFHIWPPTRT